MKFNFKMVLSKLSQSSRKVEAQWPEAILLMTGVLQSGGSLDEALDTLISEGPWPLRDELKKKLKEEKLLNRAQKIERLFAGSSLSLIKAALFISQESGGELIPQLKKSADLLKKRIELKEKAATWSAQARASAWIVGLSPFGFLFLMSFLMPESLHLFLTTRAGQVLFCLVCFLVLMGLIVVHRMAKLED